MTKLTVMVHLTLDGVMQAPGRADEDRRGGFVHGGWAQPDNDPVMDNFMAKRMATTGSGSLLLGRRTYEDFAEVWPKRTNNPYTPVLNSTRKYVASRTLTEPLPWANSTLLKGDAVGAVARLKSQGDDDHLLVMGSGELVQSLMRGNLVDEYLLMIHPLVLGSGRRLFPDGGTFAALRLIDAVTTTTGVLIATYRPADTTA